MNKSRVLSLGLIGGLLAGLLWLSACAPATPAPEGGTQSWTLYIFLVAIFAIFYFLMVRPQRKRAKEHKKVIEELKPGDDVITIGGIYGRIESINEQNVVIKVESGTTLRVARQGIGGKRVK
ncbi:MAG: preprotein translocase subunit YajC [Chloroflexota bacterium]|nr:preprotein translocase subunit YajC [Chloroflexota bacterium]